MSSKRLTQKESMSELVERTGKYFKINDEMLSKLSDEQFDGITDDDTMLCDAVRNIFDDHSLVDMNFALVYNQYIVTMRENLLGKKLSHTNHEPYAPVKMNKSRRWSRAELAFLLTVKKKEDKREYAYDDKKVTDKFNKYFADKIGVRSVGSVSRVWKKVKEGDLKLKEEKE